MLQDNMPLFSLFANSISATVKKNYHAVFANDFSM